MWYLFLIITLLYSIMISIYLYGCYKLPKSISINQANDEISFSIIIPIRNEAQNLLSLLNSLNQIDYDLNKFEILFVNDSSEDNSEAIIQQFIRKNKNITIKIQSLIRKSNSPKKDAISQAIRKAKYDWIITTDGDCEVPKFWLKTYAQEIQKGKAFFYAGPVNYQGGNRPIEIYQKIDNISLMGVTMGAFGLKHPILCNGANLCYSKATFLECNGYQLNNTIPSGDDIFLLQSIYKKYPKKVMYLANPKLIIQTKCTNTWKELLSQRVRWASKTSANMSLLNLSTALLTFFMSIVFISAFPLLCLSLYYIIVILLKVFVDLIFINKSNKLFNTKYTVLFYLFMVIINSSLCILGAIKRLKKGYKWKNRSYE